MGVRRQDITVLSFSRNGYFVLFLILYLETNGSHKIKPANSRHHPVLFQRTAFGSVQSAELCFPLNCSQDV